MFSRWSERRARVAREAAEEPGTAPEPQLVELPEPRNEAEEEALLESLGLPRPEDVSGPEIRKFLAANVPEFLRRRALRTLWRSDPTFAVLDGLNDYDEDFNLPEFNQKVLATAYQVGKGIVREVEEKVTALADADDMPLPAEPEPIEPLQSETGEPVSRTASAVAEPDFDQSSEKVFAPKRMSFDT